MSHRRLLAILLFVISVICLSRSQTRRPIDPQKCTLSGKITNKPAKVFSVRLKSLEKNPLDRYDGYSAQVSSDGTFLFEDIAPGKYRLIADADDFVPTEYGAPAPGQSGTPIDLRPGEHRRGIQIAVAPKRVVCGKITDEKGTPLPKTEIYALRHNPGIDWLTLDDADDMRTSTDADGNYRLPNLDPGQYFLIAAMSTWFSDFDKLTQIETETLANAEPVEVGAAPDSGPACPVNFVMRPRFGYMSHRIRGTIAEDPALPEKGLVLSFLEVNKSGATRPWPFDVIGPSRSFDLQAPPAGHYRLTLSNGRFPQMWSGPPPEFHIFSSQEIDITGKEDLNGIIVRPDPHASLTGRVTFEELAPKFACPTQEKPHISIQKLEDGQFQQIELAPDGSFSFPFVATGNYNVRVYPFRRGRAYLKSIALDGLNVGEKDGRKIALLSPGPHTLNVVLSGKAAHAEGHLPPDDFGERYLEAWAHPKATVSGKVTNTVDGKPPLVKLWSVRFNSNRSYEYATRPAADGTFQFDDVDPGIYVLLAHGPGYTISEYGAAFPALEGRALTIKAGDNLKHLVLAAAPKQPSLCGRIVDENGQLVTNAAVHAWFKTSWGGYEIQPADQHAPRDGYFQFDDLRAGRYFLWASQSTMRDPSASPIEWIQHITAYPSSPNLDDAEPIDIGYEPDSGCRHDIQIRSAPMFHIRGKLPAEIQHAEGEVFELTLIETSNAGIEWWARAKSDLQPGDSFDFDNVRAGNYKLVLRGPYKPAAWPRSFSGPCGPPSPRLLAIANGAVENRDLDDVALDLNTLVNVVGEIRVEDATKDWANIALNAFVSLGSDNALCPNSTHVSPDGKFSFERLQPATYRVNLDLRGPLYVKSILLNGQPVEGRHVALRGGQPEKLQIVVSGKGAELTATVEHTPPSAEEFRYGEPCGPSLAPGPWAFLVPDQLAKDGSGLLIGALTQEGPFEFHGVPPGRYHAVAGENFNLQYANEAFGDDAWSDPEFLRAASALGEPVEVAEGQKIQIKLHTATANLQNAMADHKHRVSIYDHCAGGCSSDVLSGVNSDQGMTSTDP